MEVQVPIIYAGVNGLVSGILTCFSVCSHVCLQLDSIAVDQITRWESEFREHLSATQGPLLTEISLGQITPEIEAKIKKVVEDHVSSFTS